MFMHKLVNFAKALGVLIVIQLALSGPSATGNWWTASANLVSAAGPRIGNFIAELAARF